MRRPSRTHVQTHTGLGTAAVATSAETGMGAHAYTVGEPTGKYCRESVKDKGSCRLREEKQE